MDRKQWEQRLKSWEQKRNPKPTWEERERILAEKRAERNRQTWRQWALKQIEEVEKKEGTNA